MCACMYAYCPVNVSRAAGPRNVDRAIITLTAYYISAKFSLISEENNQITTSKEGIINLQYINNNQYQNGSVCSSNFDTWKANLFCRYFGYETGKWGSYPENLGYVSE